MFATKTRIHPELAASELGIVVPMDELLTLDRLATTISVPAGEQIMEKDGFGRECFIVIDGEFKVERDDLTVVVGAGAVLGEMALLTLKPRSATVTATTDSNVYVLNRAEFSAVLDSCPSIAQHVLVGAARRAAA
jgi:CRP/FNR family cyclic AMP-dependent transcriptional regulator